MKPAPTAADIGLLWDAIRESATDAPRRFPKCIAHNTASIVKDGGAMAHVVDDLLYGFGIRSVWCRNLAALAGIPLRNMTWRPTARARSAWGGEGLPLADLAALLVYAERWALPVDPEPLVSAVLPGLHGKKLLTHDELAVYWWAKERHRTDVKRFGDADLSDYAGHVDLPTGYRACAGAWGLAIASPKIGKRTWKLETDFFSARAAHRSPRPEGQP